MPPFYHSQAKWPYLPYISSSCPVAHRAFTLWFHLLVFLSLAHTLTSFQLLHQLIFLSFSTVLHHVVFGLHSFRFPFGCHVRLNDHVWKFVVHMQLIWCLSKNPQCNCAIKIVRRCYRILKTYLIPIIETELCDRWNKSYCPCRHIEFCRDLTHLVSHGKWYALLCYCLTLSLH